MTLPQALCDLRVMIYSNMLSQLKLRNSLTFYTKLFLNTGAYVFAVAIP